MMWVLSFMLLCLFIVYFSFLLLSVSQEGCTYFVIVTLSAHLHLYFGKVFANLYQCHPKEIVKCSVVLQALFKNVLFFISFFNSLALVIFTSF